MREIQYIICSYLSLDQILTIVEPPCIQQILKRYPRKLPNILDICENDRVKYLKYLVYTGVKIKAEHLEKAIYNKSFGVIKYLYQLGFKPDDGYVQDFLVGNNELSIIMYFSSLGLKFNEAIFEWAFLSRKYKIIRYLCSIGYTGTKNLVNVVGDECKKYYRFEEYRNMYNKCIISIIDYQVINPEDLLQVAIKTQNTELINFLIKL